MGLIMDWPRSVLDLGSEEPSGKPSTTGQSHFGTYMIGHRAFATPGNIAMHRHNPESWWRDSAGVSQYGIAKGTLYLAMFGKIQVAMVSKEGYSWTNLM